MRNIQVVADKDSNTLLIIATAQEYRIIEAALKKLDVPARQVLIDVTMAEVTLTDDTRVRRRLAVQGRRAVGARLRWQRERRRRSVADQSGRAFGCRRRTAAANPPLALAQGFFYIINNSNFPGGIQAALHLLDTYGNTKVLANPHLSALDNQKATIKAGDRIPICQQSIVGQHDQRRHDDVAIHRHRRADAGDAAHQPGRARHARRAGRGEHPGQHREPVRCAADQHALGAIARLRAVGPDDGDGRPHQRDAEEFVAGAAAALAHSRSSAACSAIRRSPTTGPSSSCSSRRG